jgi:hypothetical protein
MKTKFKKVWILFIVVFYIILLSNFSNSSPFETWKTCSQTWGQSCNSTTLDDSFKGAEGLNGTQPNGCNGTQSAGLSYPYISEVYINATNFFPETGINVTCEFVQNVGGSTYFEYLWYYNTTHWINIQNWTNTSSGTTFNRSANFKLNSSEGTNIIRCILSFNFSANSNQGMIPDECANVTYSDFYDNDDVNFTITGRLTYDFWNLTNYTTGENISSGQTFNRTNLINVSAHWNKFINNAWVEHNGTGSWHNYTISNFTGNWTNYTLNLSNSSEFNVTTIAINAIYANNTFSATNNTSPLLYFSLSAGNAPNITNFWFNYSGITTNRTNKYTNLTIYANVSDDVGLSRVTANITYPSPAGSTIVNMTGDTSPGWHLWNYTFGNDLHLNSTGNYAVRITAFDIGNQNKSSGNDTGSPENMNFTVYSNYTLNLTSNYSVFNRGENVTIQALDVNNLTVDSVNWTVNVTKINETSNFTPQQTTFNYTILPSDPEGNYSILVNASKNNNTGNSTWQFNVSKNFSLTISTTTALSPGNNLNISVYLSNARGELHTSLVDANITCPDGMHPLTFSSGYASRLCTAPNSYNTPFNITVNVTDQYNNTGENYTTFTTTSAPPSGGGGGGGGGGFVTTPKKNCTDGTFYDQCSSNRPFYCSNGTLIEYCSVCGCNPGYGCQLDGSCILAKEEDFNFTIDSTEIEINQGEDKNIIGHLTNTGNTILSLISFLNASDCCNISIPSTIDLNEKEEKEFTISIHVPLITSTGEYLIKIGIGTELFKKEKTFKVIVVQSPYYSYLSDIETELKNLEMEIQEYKKSGVNIGNLENLLEQSKLLLNNANSSISSDQINVLSNSLSDIKNNLNYIRSSLTPLRAQVFISQNAWLISLLIVMIILTTYFVPEVFMPLNKIEKEMKKLRNEEKVSVSSRVETEKQYFMRKIDESTFSKIMISKQDNILKLRATIKEMENERTKILARAHPKEMIKWFGRNIKNLPKNIKNLFVMLFKKIKVNLFKKVKIKMVI